MDTTSIYMILLSLLGCHFGSTIAKAMGGISKMDKMDKMGERLEIVTPKEGMEEVFTSQLPTGMVKEEIARIKRLRERIANNPAFRKTIQEITCSTPNCIECSDLQRKLNALLLRRMEGMAQVSGNDDSTKCTHTKKVISGPNGTKIAVVVHTPLTLGTEGNPAVVYAHIGGAMFGSADVFQPLISRLANRNQVVYIAVDFRHAPPTGITAIVHDFYTAFKYIQNKPKLFGVDPSRLAIAGDSYGGQIALATMVMLAKNGEGNLAKLAMLGYPMVSDYHNGGAERLNSTEGSDDPMTKNERLNSPVIKNVLKCLAPETADSHAKLMLYPATEVKEELLQRMPATIIFGKEFDMFKTEARTLASRLRAAGRLLHEYEQPGLSHRAMAGKAGKEYLEKYKAAVDNYLIN